MSFEHEQPRFSAQAAAELRKLATRTAGAVGAAAQSAVTRQQMGELLHYASGASPSNAQRMLVDSYICIIPFTLIGHGELQSQRSSKQAILGTCEGQAAGVILSKRTLVRQGALELVLGRIGTEETLGQQGLLREARREPQSQGCVPDLPLREFWGSRGDARGPPGARRGVPGAAGGQPGRGRRGARCACPETHCASSLNRVWWFPLHILPAHT